MFHSLNSLREYYIHASDGLVGPVGDFYLDAKSWSIRFLMVPHLDGDVHIPTSEIGSIDTFTKTIHLKISTWQIEKAHALHGLVSYEKLCKFRVHARDYDFGRLRDILADRNTWQVKFIEIKKDDWLLFQSTLIPASILDYVFVETMIVEIRTGRKEVMSSPTYHSLKFDDKSGQDYLHHFINPPDLRTAA